MTLEDWMDNQSREFDKLFPDYIYSFVVITPGQERLTISNGEPDHIREMYEELAEEAGKGENIVTRRVS
jgi:hypothetical protein